MNKDRHFPKPWRIEEPSSECLCIVDAEGYKIAYIYHGNGEREWYMGRPTTADAWRIAKGIIKRINEEESPPASEG